jgi:hypothetical protein
MECLYRFTLALPSRVGVLEIVQVRRHLNVSGVLTGYSWK